jgi:fimbrial chaperone protein
VSSTTIGGSIGPAVVLMASLFHASSGLAAARISAYPTKIHLSARVSSGLLTLENVGDEVMRFQLSLVAWDQTREGEPRFSATEDIVCFPPLLNLEPGAKRPIRVGTTAPAGERERTYRVFIEQLPPLRTQDQPVQEHQVRVLTRLGVPIFVTPSKPVVGRGIELADVSEGKFSIVVRNTGNVHFQSLKVRLLALGPSGARVFDRELPGAYVLAGGSRAYPIELSVSECARGGRLEIEVTTAQDKFGERFEFPTGACAR